MPLFWRLTSVNPGRYDDIKTQAAALLGLDNFEGARFEFNRTMTQKFALLHNVSLAAGQPGSYEFGAHVGDERTLLASRIDMAGRLTGRLNMQLTDAVGVRLQAQVAPEAQGNSFRADVDYKGGDFFGGGYYMAAQNLVGASYLQSLSDKLSIGTEGFMHMQNRKVRGGSGAARYIWGGKGENVLVAKIGTFGNGMAEIAYSRKVSEKVSLATEMQYYHSQLCHFGVGYEFKLRTAVFKGHVASDTTCSAVLEEHIQPGINLVLSGQLNHKKKDYKFGVGLTIGGA